MDHAEPIFRLMAEALALGMLVGIERYKGRAPGEKKSAGVRTFVILGLLGGVSGLLDQPLFTAITFVAIAVLLVLGYQKYPEDSVGLTTEFAALLLFWICHLLFSHETLAISLGIVLTIFLALKERLHSLVKEQISEAELFATLKFLAVVLVVYPLLPDQNYGPFGFFNPHQIWGLVILVSTTSLGGYFLSRALGPKRGLLASALSGGIVSTTAVTMSLAARAKESPESSRLYGAAAVVANSVQAPRLLILLWFVSPDLARALTIPLTTMAVVGVVGSWILARKALFESDVDFELENPYSVRPALKFAAFFAVISLVVHAADHWLGESGVFVASALAGLASVSAATLSVGDMVSSGAVVVATGALAVLLAMVVNAASKLTLTVINGTTEMACWLAGGLITILASGWLLLVATASLTS